MLDRHDVHRDIRNDRLSAECPAVSSAPDDDRFGREDGAPQAGTDAGSALSALVERVRETGYAFTTVTPATHARIEARASGIRATGLRDVFGWSRPFDPESVPADILALMRRAGVLVEGRDGWRSAIRLSSLDNELFVHSAYPPTAADTVFFGPDTARFVAAVVAHLGERTMPVRRAVDIGSGSGAAGIAIAKRSPGADVLLVDVNETALQLSSVNARLARVEATTRRSDLLRSVEGDFDLIVSNPPFMLDREGRTYRHGGGALGEGLPLAVVEAAADRLAPGGTLVLFSGSVIVEGRDPFRAAAIAACKRAGLVWRYREVDPDAYGEELDHPAYARGERIALVVLTATRASAA